MHRQHDDRHDGEFESIPNQSGDEQAQAPVSEQFLEDDLFEHVPADHIEVDAADDIFEDVPADAMDQDSDVVLCFAHTLDPPPMHHILDNATGGLSDVMPSYDRLVSLARQVCKLIRRRDTQPKLLERCFAGAGATWAHPLIKSFQAAIYPKRWGTLVFSVPQLLKVEKCMRRWFSLDAWARGDEAAPPDSKTTQRVEDTDAFVSSPFAWGWLRAIEHLAVLLRRLTAWVESCDCHWHLIKDFVMGGWGGDEGQVPKLWRG